MSAGVGAGLVVRALEVAYGGTVVGLRGVGVEVRPGQVVALLGANGAGKTSLLRSVSGLLRPQRGAVTAGSVELDGERIDQLDAPAIVRRGVAQVMEARRIFAELTVEENLRAGAHTRRDRAGIRATYEHVLDLFPVLAGRLRSTAGYLSGGEQQMLAIGRALMADPRLLLLDEPSLGLAPLVVERIAGIVARINEEGTSVLLVEQNAHMALSIAQYGYVLEHGRIARSGPAAELADDPEIRDLYLGTAVAGRRSYADLRPRPRQRWTA